MSEDTLYRNLLQLGLGVEACLREKNASAALILLYSAIDTTGWLASDKRFSTRSSFIEWVDHYLLPARPLPATATDLYAARCGLLHTLTAESALADGGGARRICYAWGTASAEELQRTLKQLPEARGFVALHVNDLYEGWRLGLAAFMDELAGDPRRRQDVLAKGAKFFANVDVGVFGGASSSAAG